MTTDSHPTTGGGDLLELSRDHLLHRNTIGLGAALFMTFALMAPAFSLFGTTGPMASQVGPPLPLVFIVAMLGILCTGNALVQFTRRYPSSGSFVTFISKGLGGRVGLISGVGLIIGYTFCTAAVIALFGVWTQTVLQRELSLNVPWWVLGILAGAGLTLLAARGLGISARGAAVLFLFEVIIIIIVSFFTVFKGGFSGLSMTPFSPSAITGGSGFGLAAVLSVYCFIGYEGAVSLGEETENPRRNTPITVVVGIVALSALFIFASYAVVVGFGVTHMAALAADPASWDTLGRHYVGSWFGVFIDLAGITSTLGCGLAAINGYPRIIYNVSRAGLFPRFLARTGSRWRTPYWSLIIFGVVVTVIPLIGVAFGLTTAELFGVISTYGALPVTIIYLIVNLGLIVYWFAHQRTGSFWTHLVIPIVGASIWVYPIYLALKPGEGPFHWTWLFVVVPVILGAILLVVVLRQGKNPSLLASVLAGEHEDVLVPNGVDDSALPSPKPEPV